MKVEEEWVSYQCKPRFKKKVSSEEHSMCDKVKLEKGSDSEVGKTTCITCGKRHYGECLFFTGVILDVVKMDTK